MKTIRQIFFLLLSIVVLVACDSGGSSRDIIPPIITLLGDNPQIYAIGEVYVEPGATAMDNRDGDLSANIVIDASEVDSSAPGQYTVTYNVSDTAGNAAVTVSRTVLYEDQTPPAIVLAGDHPQFIVLGNPYVELGATAVDNVDGDLTDAILIDATRVNVAAVGSYEVTYDVSDAAGNAADTASRTVTVHRVASIDLLANTFLMIANGTSSPELTISFKDNNGALIDESEVTYELRVNGVPQPTSQFTTMLDGDYALTIVAYGIESNVVDVRARERKAYPIIELPVIFHIVHFGEAIGVAPNLHASAADAVLDRFNTAYSNQLGSSDPNAVDASVRFRLASMAPDGSIISEPGIWRIDGTDYDDGAPHSPAPNSTDIAGDRVFGAYEGLRLFGETYWDPRQYMNVYLFNTYSSIGHFPLAIEGSPIPGLKTVPADTEPSSVRSSEIPSVFLKQSQIHRWAAHEMGHALGLLHPFARQSDRACGPGDYCADTYTYNYYTGAACPGNLGLMERTSIMDYQGAFNTITYDQRERIRLVLNSAIWMKELQYSEK